MDYNKSQRPVAPLFIGFPVPMKRDDSTERSASLTMTYFHPWTLRSQDSDKDHVHFAGCLRKSDATRESSLA